MRVAGRRSVPEHGQRAQEFTLILRSLCEDRSGIFEVGDIVDQDEDVEHQPVAVRGEDRICLVAVNGPLILRSRLVGAVQPLCAP